MTSQNENLHVINIKQQVFIIIFFQILDMIQLNWLVC